MKKKSPGPAPRDNSLCFNARMNDRPISDINKEQLSGAQFFFTFPHSEEFYILQVSFFISRVNYHSLFSQERTQLCHPSFYMSN